MSEEIQPETLAPDTDAARAEALAALDRQRLPVDTLRDALPHLRRPFSPEAIRFKVQTVFSGNSGCIVVAYIDARLAIDRLNAVCGGDWTAVPVDTPDAKHMWCRMTVFGQPRIDVGQTNKGFSKDLWSDALKRAGVQFGVGVSVYALPQITLWMRESHGRLELRGKGDRETIVLTEHGHMKLREGYARWLVEHGVARFGPPLDHGDVVGATIEEDLGTEITSGEGTGAEPGWSGLTDEVVADIEALLQVASDFGHPLDRASVQLRLNEQPAEVVVSWMADTREMLAKKREPEGGDDVDRR